MNTNSIVWRCPILPQSQLPAPPETGLPARTEGATIDLNKDGKLNFQRYQTTSGVIDTFGQEPCIPDARLDDLRLMAQTSGVKVITQGDVADPGVLYSFNRASDFSSKGYRYVSVTAPPPASETLGQVTNKVAAREGFGIGNKWAIDFSNPARPEFLIYKA